MVVINTCGFIDSAKSEAIDTILSAAQLKAGGPDRGKILVTGCLSQRYQADILEELPEIDGIMGTGCFGDIVPALEQVMNGQECRHFADINGPCGGAAPGAVHPPGSTPISASPRGAATAALIA